MQQVTATQLAKIGKCERQVYFDHHYGEDKELTEVFVRRGNEEHRRFYEHLSGGKDKRCFIATAVFGVDAAETEFLRQFRDACLSPSFAGRQFIALYYRVSPRVIPYLERWPLVKTIIRKLLLRFVYWWKS